LLRYVSPEMAHSGHGVTSASMDCRRLGDAASRCFRASAAVVLRMAACACVETGQSSIGFVGCLETPHVPSIRSFTSEHFELFE
jgi:hypothetical protein